MLPFAQLLRHERLATAITDHPVRLAVFLSVLWLIPGLVGHDPWKTEDAQNIAVVLHLLRSGDWLVPMLAGEPFLTSPNLIYLSSALTATLFSPVLPLHDGARIAAGFYMALTLLFTSMAGRELLGGNKGYLAALLLLGCVGILVRGHEPLAEVAQLSGFAMGIYALVLSARRPAVAGIWLGLGLGISIFATGFVEPLMFGITLLALPAVSARWRTRGYLLTLTIGVGVMLPLALAWPLLLHNHSPRLFTQWFWVENVGRLQGIFLTGIFDSRYSNLEVLSWFAWPAWPFALWALWSERRNIQSKPEIVFPATMFVVFLAFVIALGEKSDLLGLPLLLPLSLLAAASFSTVRRGAGNAFYWFAIMAFTFAAFVIWFYWMAADVGVPARLWKHLMKLQPAYQSDGRAFAIAFAALVTAGWFFLLFNVKRSAERPVIIWAAGITLMWALVGSLLLRYIDTGRTYRGVFGQLVKALPARHGCVAGQSLGGPQRALLYYFGNLVTVPHNRPGKNPDCQFLITQDTPSRPVRVGENWVLLWEGNRPRDRKERYRLYQKS
ncbi:MAG: ArnT family glycosyltransferase [Burkholderiales bacterium]